jgi:hypothetical protein
MTVYLDAEITGSDSYHFGGAQIQYMLVYLDTLGPDVRIPDTNNPDQIGFAGWLALGSEADYGPDFPNLFWTERIWINFQHFQWHPVPTRNPGDAVDLVVWASDVRWALSPGTHGFLLVFGV